MIQHHTFHDKTFVLHKIELNGHQYSAWYNADGTPFSAELILRSGVVRNVSESHHEVMRQLTVIGKRYVAGSAT